ncbi:S41 family peptidase [Tahibacter soli]|uniref:S41 family peptidase n=1 Tax=Tahibacter soli TaxID=2983605 RepID=A0A9X3YJI9_9GAMM|nr:S41 family peptidase [Tahibacter soli]MDC8013447.1 S41 family peptidase [Tahibacter soli]
MSRIASIPTIALALLFASGAGAQTARKPVAAVASAIEDNYFDAARGKTIADDLRQASADGAFDALTEPAKLAEALTERLKPLDRHFRVTWSDGAGRSGPSAPRPPSGDGIERVDVLPGNIGYLKLTHFANFEFGDRDAPVRRAIDAALARVAGSDAIVVDLRDNRGGSPNMVGYLVSAFTPRGADIYNTFHARNGGTTSEAPAEPYAQPMLTVPLYVLINGRTASAGEAFSYTVKNAKRATIVGETSRGAANPGGFVEVGDGYAVFVSDGTPVSPVTKTNWEGTGVAPDVAVPAAEALDKATELVRGPKSI